MRLARTVGNRASWLFLVSFVLGATALIQAQEQREDAKPDNRPEAGRPSQNEPARDAKPSQQQGEEKATRQDNHNNEEKPARTNNEDKASRSENDSGSARQGGSKSQGTRGEATGEGGQKRAGQRGGHIPDDKFRASFGRQHTFKMQRPTVVGSEPTFQSSGYSFTLIDAWPEEWAYSDECYIDYIDGDYFLVDLAHPDVRLAVFVVL